MQVLAVIHTTERNETKKERYHFGPQKRVLSLKPQTYVRDKKKVPSWLQAVFFLSETHLSFDFVC